MPRKLTRMRFVAVLGLLLGGMVANPSSQNLALFWQFVQQAKLTGSKGAAFDGFGQPLAIAGDTVVVGAHSASVGANSNQGAAHVFRRFHVCLIGCSSLWIELARLTASDAAADDYSFGNAVAIVDDTVVVGALFYDNFRGAAYVFTQTGGTWPETARLTTSNIAAGDLSNFGSSVAIDGDTIVVGASGNDVNGNQDQGAAYVFTKAGGDWIETAQLTASDGTEGDRFGNDVAIAGDTIVVGAWNADAGQGAVYMFTRTGNTWTETTELEPPQGTPYLFGASVGIDGDRVVVGAPNEHAGGKGIGRAYVFTRYGNIWISDALVASDGFAGNGFGWDVAVSGDRVVVGASKAVNDGSVFNGAAYIFSHTGTGWAQKKLVSPGEPHDSFGGAVAIDGNTVVVGAADADVGGKVNQGAAYVFVRRPFLLLP
jgi:FG-GAP repeat